MDFELYAEGRIDLDGSHTAIIESDLLECSLTVNENSNRPQYIKLKSAGRVCGIILVEIKKSKTNKIYLDRFKMHFLNIRDKDTVKVEEFQPEEAQTVELRVSSDFSERDEVCFVGKPVTKGEKTAIYTFAGQPRTVEILKTNPSGIVVITAATNITTTGAKMEAEETPVTYKDIGGLSREIKKIREDIEFPLRSPETFDYLGVQPPRGIILYGPPGTGKTLIARALSNEVGAEFYLIRGPEIFSMWYGESERRLNEIFNEAQKNAPSVILIDELDALAPRRETAQGELERRIVAILLTRMDGLKKLKGVVVVGTTNRIDSIDVALIREGRFWPVIKIAVPDSAGRKEILEILTRRMPLSDVDLNIVADKTHGFVGADLASLCREAAYNALRRFIPIGMLEKGQIVPPADMEICLADFEDAISNIPPSAMREFLIEIPKVSWKDIGGLDEIKSLLIKSTTWSTTKRNLLLRFGIKPAKGILLYGPPGTGKTILAKAVATECGANFISVKGPEMRSKWFGESEERIRYLFAKAREVAPCVIFFDEIDAAAPERGRDIGGITDTIVNQILSEMDGIEGAVGVFILGATNRPELLDQALLRPGRFDYQIEVPLPDLQGRRAIFNIYVKNKPLAPDVNLDELLELTASFSGAEIEEVVREATWEAIEKADFEAEKVKVTMAQLKDAITRVQQTRDKLKPKPIGFRTTEEGNK
jgi:transitional endoplasmic reticulum ATPase